MMFHKKTTGLIAYFMRAYPGRTFVMILCLLVAGLTEGVGVTAMLPLLDVGTTGKPSTALGRRVADMAAAMGLPPTFETFLLILVGGHSLSRGPVPGWPCARWDTR